MLEMLLLFIFFLISTVHFKNPFDLIAANERNRNHATDSSVRRVKRIATESSAAKFTYHNHYLLRVLIYFSLLL